MPKRSYIDPGDEFTLDLTVEGSNFYVTTELCKKAMRTCGRSKDTFRDEAEQNRWWRIDLAVVNQKMPERWVENCIKYADGLNAAAYKNGRRGVAMTFANLVQYILNTGKMDDWMAKGGRVIRAS